MIFFRGVIHGASENVQHAAVNRTALNLLKAEIHFFEIKLFQVGRRSETQKAVAEKEGAFDSNACSYSGVDV